MQMLCEMIAGKSFFAREPGSRKGRPHDKSGVYNARSSGIMTARHLKQLLHFIYFQQWQAICARQVFAVPGHVIPLGWRAFAVERGYESASDEQLAL